MEGLMECPFCGAKPVLVSDFKPGRNSCQTAMVRCYNCHADGYIADSCLNESEQTAIDRWNTRATEPLMEEVAKKVADMYWKDQLLKEMADIIEALRVGHYGRWASKAIDVLQKYREATSETSNV